MLLTFSSPLRSGLAKSGVQVCKSQSKRKSVTLFYIVKLKAPSGNYRKSHGSWVCLHFTISRMCLRSGRGPFLYEIQKAVQQQTPSVLMLLDPTRRALAALFVARYPDPAALLNAGSSRTSLACLLTVTGPASSRKPFGRHLVRDADATGICPSASAISPVTSSPLESKQVVQSVENPGSGRSIRRLWIKDRIG